mmetsp:Transcript_6625/g.13428  ORF Transcript_6625/g.13428 Transcript_6625/m.13428 type:complete len:157 (+) Transcript_6625:171-641(+)
MVVLSRTATVKGSVPEVFRFIADWTHIPKWDPGTLSSVRVTDGGAEAGAPVGVGSQFDLVTEFRGSKSDMRYTVEKWVENSTVRYVGEGDRAVTVDDISFRPGSEEKTTVVDYRADIQLRGWMSIFTFLINGPLQKLGDDAINGIESACRKRFADS